MRVSSFVPRAMVKSYFKAIQKTNVTSQNLRLDSQLHDMNKPQRCMTVVLTLLECLVHVIHSVASDKTWIRGGPAVSVEGETCRSAGTEQDGLRPK